MSWRWLLWLIPLFIIALAATAPARLIEGGAVQGLHPTSTKGTIWHGTTTITADMPTGGKLHLQDVSWQLSPWKLFLGQANVALKIPSSNYLHGELNINAGLNELQLSGNLQGAVQPAVTQMKLPVPITTAGNWALNIANFQVSDFNSEKICDNLDAQLTASTMEMRLNRQWHPLGDYQAQLSCSNEHSLVVTLADNNLVGLRLNAQVSGRITAPQVSLQGSMQPSAQTPKPITDVLVFLGEPDAQGRYHFKW